LSGSDHRNETGAADMERFALDPHVFRVGRFRAGMLEKMDNYRRVARYRVGRLIGFASEFDESYQPMLVGCCTNPCDRA